MVFDREQFQIPILLEDESLLCVINPYSTCQLQNVQSLKRIHEQRHQSYTAGLTSIP